MFLFILSFKKVNSHYKRCGGGERPKKNFIIFSIVELKKVLVEPAGGLKTPATKKTKKTEPLRPRGGVKYPTLSVRTTKKNLIKPKYCLQFLHLNNC